jgi:hypothetical protein
LNIGPLRRCKADPPLLTGGVDRLGPLHLQQVPQKGRGIFIASDNDHHAPPLAEGILIDENLVFGKAFGGGLLQLISGGSANRSTWGTQNRCAQQPDSGDWAESGH